MNALGVRACVVSVGNELLFGETVDTNSAWMGRVLAARGITVVRRYTVADVAEEIRHAVREAADIADLVLVSGGLGPTSDDVTRPTVAELIGAALEVDQALLQSLRERFEARGYGELPVPNVSQAEVPRGARVLLNPRGTAPGLAMRFSEAWVVLLPGVPRELRAIFGGELSDFLEVEFGDRALLVSHRMVHTTGVPESRLAELVERAFARPPAIAELAPDVSVAYLPDLRGVDLRLTARGLRGGLQTRAGDGIDYLRGADVRIEPERPLAVQADGEYIGETPLRLGVAPRALSVLLARGPNPLLSG